MTMLGIFRPNAMIVQISEVDLHLRIRLVANGAHPVVGLLARRFMTTSSGSTWLTNDLFMSDAIAFALNDC